MQQERQNVTLNDFSMLSMIGIGNYAKVILVRRQANGKIYAMKIIKKKKHQNELKGIKKNHAYIEKDILTQCTHPFIIKLHSTFQRQRKLYYILQYCPGGQLFGVIRRLKRLSEESAKFYAAQILMVLEHIHFKGFIYRDLKPENVLIDTNGYIKLIDFGLSCRLNELNKTDLFAGTPQYMPPEILTKGVKLGEFTDWWAFGIIIFQMIAGFPPFYVQNQKFEMIKKKICYEQPPLYFINNPILKDLLQKLLEKVPQQRLGTKGIQQIKQHSWFYGFNWEGLLQGQLTPPFKPQIKSDSDTQWFDIDHKDLTPPEEQSQKNSIQKYQQFSSSWKSSDFSPQNDASPTEIVINIHEQLNR